jgi:hypothetical protein
MATEPPPSESAEPEPAESEPAQTRDVFDGLVLDENFVRGGAYEPPHRTREAIGRYQGESLRYSAPLRPVDDLPGRKKARKKPPKNAPRIKARRAGRRDLTSWLPLTAAITVVALLLLFRR